MASSRLGALLGDAPRAPEEQSLARLRVSIKAALRHGASQTMVANVCRSELAFAKQRAPPSELANSLGRMLRHKPKTLRAGNLRKMESLVAKSKALGLGGQQRPIAELARRVVAEQIIKRTRQLLKKKGAAASSSSHWLKAKHDIEQRRQLHRAANFEHRALLAAEKAEREALLENQFGSNVGDHFGKAEREALLESQPWSPSVVLRKKPAATDRSESSLTESAGWELVS